MAESWKATLSFSTLIKKYILLQSQVVSAVRNVASQISQATPGKFLFAAIPNEPGNPDGESIRPIAQVNGVIKNAISNIKNG